MAYDWIVVGSGLTGATFAERMAAAGKRVLVVERRRHLGGNAYDAYDENGVLIHPYGPHIFHTNSEKVFSYLSRFTGWRPYVHRVLAEIRGQLVPLPFNLNTLHALYPKGLAARLEEKLLQHFGHGARVPILKLRETEDEELKELAEFVYGNVFLNYTKKQWGVPPEALDPAVTARVPVVVARDDRYFADRYQGLPDQGYTRMIERMLAHENIHVLLGVDYLKERDHLKAERVLYTGPLDAFFDYAFGPLPYRSLRFRWRRFAAERALPAAVVNHPNEHPFTRVAEYKQLTGQKSPYTSLSYEYPEPHAPGENEPYYPIPKAENQRLLARYKELMREAPNVLFAGRLADYRYYNMDQAVARALKLAEEAL